MLLLRKEPENIKDMLAVCVQKGQVVGHVPRNLAPLLVYFLDRDMCKGFAKVTAMPLNCGALTVAGVASTIKVLGKVVHNTVSIKRKYKNSRGQYNHRAVGAGPAGAAVAGPIFKMAPSTTHGKRASRKLCNTLLGYAKKQQIVEFMLLYRMH